MTSTDEGYGLVKQEDGTYAVASKTCPECGETFIMRKAHVATSPRHKQWVRGELQPEVPVPAQPPGHKYNAQNLPPRIVFGVSMPCPRCKGIPTKRKDGYVEPLTLDPHKKTQICPRCDGYGIVPNTGP